MRRGGALALGRLHPDKGFELLLEAIAQTRGIELQIAGDGPSRSSLERLAGAPRHCRPRPLSRLAQ